MAKNKKTKAKAAKPKAVKPKAAAPKKTASKKAAPKKAAAKKTAVKTSAAKKSVAKKTTPPKASKPGKVLPFKPLPKTAKSSGDFKKNFFMPLEDRVLVQPEGKSDRTPGGLFIPETVQERPSQGKVVAVGKGARKKKGGIRPLDVKLGDSVLYGAHSGTALELEGQDVILLREEEILGVLKP